MEIPKIFSQLAKCTLRVIVPFTGLLAVLTISLYQLRNEPSLERLLECIRALQALFVFIQGINCNNKWEEGNDERL